jgi:hypothetical protein
MGYVGNEPSVNFTSFAKQDLTGVTGSPVKRGFTLTYAVANANEIEVFVNNVRQEPTEAYTVSGTALTMTGDVETTDDFYIIYLGKALQTTVPPDGSVTNSKIANSTIDLTSKVTGVLPVANSQSNTPAFGAYLGSAQTVTNNVDTKLNINTEEFDTNSNFNTSNYRFTPTVAGKYYMFGQVSGLRETGNITRLTVYIYKNGSRVKQADLYINPTSQVLSALNINTFGIISMNGTSDYLELYGRLRAYNSGTIQIESGANHTFFGGYKLIGG